jgi:hypothetical protein
MTKELKHTNVIFQIAILLFLIIYPNLFLEMPFFVDSWFFPRYVVLFAIFLLAILSLKNTKINLFFIIFSTINVILSTISYFNTLEDYKIITLYGENGRGDGIFYQILLIFFLIFSLNTLKSFKNFSKIFFFLSISALIQSYMVFLQYSYVQFPKIPILGSFLPYDVKQTVGFMGHSGYVAGFLFLILIFNLYLLEYKNYKKPLTIFIFILIIANSIGLGLTENRTSIIAAIFVLLTYGFIRLRTIHIPIIAFLSCILISFSTQFVYKSPQTSEKIFINSTTLETRLIIWDIAKILYPQSWGFPFVGGGTGSFKLLISEKLDPMKLFEFYEKEIGWKDTSQIKEFKVFDKNSTKRERRFLVTWKDGKQALQNIALDKVHNFYFDRAFTIGTIGAVLWLLFYLYPIFWYVFKATKSQRTLEFTVLVVALVGLQVYYALWFAMPQFEPIHVFIGAMAWVSIERASQLPQGQKIHSLPTHPIANRTES